jgi:DNA-directed RNA polymerase subunit M/transcription elongation factor TFIIS
MGMQFRATCQQCGEVFVANDGPSMSSLLLHCNRCGCEKWLDTASLPTGWSYVEYEPANDSRVELEPCACGGSFLTAAKARCPKCKSENWDPTPPGPVLMYD